MPRTAAGLRPEDRLSRETVDPAWQQWIDLVQLAVAESQRPVWGAAVSVRAARAPDAPLLHGASICVPDATFVLRLASYLGIVGFRSVDPLDVILAGVVRDLRQADTLATTLAISVDTVGVLGQLSALPLLLNAARELTAEASRAWQRGYCPVCGSWPSMAELRGIQRERRLRCGCCGSDWLLPVLRCTYCDETDHKKLGFLSSDGNDHGVRVETCATCNGYLKSVTTLGALPFAALAAKDLETVPFDIAAADRGFTRPARPGWQVQVELVR